MRSILAILALAAVLAAGCSADHPERERDAADEARFRVLVFTKASGWVHDSIEEGVAAVRRLGAEHGFGVHHTDEASAFTEESLAAYDVVVFLNTSETVFDDAQRAAFKSFIRNGGGFAGVHAASDTEYDWPWYGGLVGAYFASHPEIQEATIHVVDPGHPSTAHLPEQWVRTDEWYDFRDPPDGVNVLLMLDEDSYEGGRMGDHHPIAWYHEYDGGRSWYTALGHTRESYREPLFLQHLLGGIAWAAGAR
jgi:type 1 glutamine amidotransferase